MLSFLLMKIIRTLRPPPSHANQLAAPGADPARVNRLLTLTLTQTLLLLAFPSNPPLLRLSNQQVIQKGNSTKFLAGSGPTVPEKCPETGAGFLMGGPIWAEALHDFEWIKQLREGLERDKACYAQYDKLRGMLLNVSEELPDVPLYFNAHDVCKTVKCTPFKTELLRSAILNAGEACWQAAMACTPAIHQTINDTLTFRPTPQYQFYGRASFYSHPAADLSIITAQLNS